MQLINQHLVKSNLLRLTKLKLQNYTKLLLVVKTGILFLFSVSILLLSASNNFLFFKELSICITVFGFTFLLKNKLFSN